MHQLYPLLAGATGSMIIAIASCVVLAIIVFMIGYSRGFTRTGWGAFIWAIVCTVWYFIVRGNDNFIMSLSMAAIMTVAGFIIFGILSAILRRKRKVIEVPYNVFEKAEYGPSKPVDLNEMAVYQGEPEDEEAKKVDKTKFFEDERGFTDKPKLVNRIFGGFIAVINFFLVVSGLAYLAVAVLPGFTGINMEEVLSNVGLQKLYPSMQSYGVDFALIALMMGMAYGGYRAGFFRGLFGFVRAISSFVALGFAIFFPLSGSVVATNMNGFFTNVCASFIPASATEFVPSLNSILGGIFTGICIFIISLIVLWLLCSLFKALVKQTRHSKMFKTIDSFVGAVIMVLLAVLLVAFIVLILGCVQYFGASFNLNLIYTEDSRLISGFFSLFEESLLPILDKFR